MKWETIDRWQIDDLMNGKEVRAPTEFKAIQKLDAPEQSDNSDNGCNSYQPDQNFA